MKLSYPGYGRVARRLGIDLHKYKTLAELKTAGMLSASDLIVVTEPGNRCDVEDLDELDSRWMAAAQIVVDAAYANPFDHSLVCRADARAGRGILTIFTLSKAVNLAGARIGGILSRRGSGDAPSQDPRFWDAFSVSVLATLSTELGREAIEACPRSRAQMMDRIAAALRELGAPSRPSPSALFLTVSSVSAGTDTVRMLHERLDGKAFSDGAEMLLRIDVSRANLEKLIR